MLAAADLRFSDDEREASEQFARLLESSSNGSTSEEAWQRVRTWASIADSTMAVRGQVLQVAGARLLDGAFPATVGLLAPLLRLVDPERYDVLLSGDLKGSATALDEANGSVVLGASNADVIAVVTGAEVQLLKPGMVDPAVEADLSRSFGRIDLDTCERLGPARPVSDGDLRTWLATARVAVAADMVGSARAVYEATVTYLKERVQFGQPVASFQAVQHKLVDMAILVETATAALDYAACSVDAASDDALTAAAVAKSQAATAAIRCAVSAVRLQGAIGLTWDNDVHRHLRRAYASDQLFGSAAWHRSELGRRIATGRL
jgi:hypothetical protein